MAVAKAPEPDVVSFDQFIGLRNNVSVDSFDVGDLDAAVNVDIDDELNIRRRRGYAAVSGLTSAYHSTYSDGSTMLAVSGSSLYRVWPATGLQAAVVGGLDPTLRLSYFDLGGRIYYSNGAQLGCVDGGIRRPWGIDPPSGQPVTSRVNGILPPGTYKVAMTFIRSDGQESGTGAAGEVDIPVDPSGVNTGGLNFASLPVSSDPAVTIRRLYVSGPNSSELYAQKDLQASDTSATYLTLRSGGALLRTQFLSPPPPGQCIGYFGGRALVAAGPRLYISEPYAPELFDLRRGYRFAGQISMVAPVDDGVFVSAGDKIVFIAGREIATGVYTQKLAYPAIPGTLAYGDAEGLFPDAQGRVALFATTRGLCAGLNGGTVKNITARRYSYPPRERGCGAVRSFGGTIQYIAVLEGTEGAANAAL